MPPNLRPFTGCVDSVYVGVARRYGTTQVTRDDEQRSRAAAVIPCQTPEEALRNRQIPKRTTRSDAEPPDVDRCFRAVLSVLRLICGDALFGSIQGIVMAVTLHWHRSG